jgi:hypothetical protein
MSYGQLAHGTRTPRTWPNILLKKDTPVKTTGSEGIIGL